jgi:hypothetical protein
MIIWVSLRWLTHSPATAGLLGRVHHHRRDRRHLKRPARRPRVAAPQLRSCEERTRCAKDTGLRNLPPHGYDENQIWCEITALACELLAWSQMLALPGPARRWEPRRLRLMLFACAGRLVRGDRRLRLRLAASWPRASQTTAAVGRLHALAPS